MEAAVEYAWQPFDGPQTEFLSRGEDEILFGGAAGPGKTMCLIMAALRFSHHPRYHGVIFRRTFPQLQEIIDRSREWVPCFDPNAVWKETKHRWELSAGGFLTLSHMQHESSKYDHQGKEYSFIGFDELTQFEEGQFKYLFSRLRSTSVELPKQVRSTTNPGGIGHGWVKKRYRIGIVEPRTTIYEDSVDVLTGEVRTMTRSFIPATLDDNPALLTNDPMYLARLEMLPEAEKMRLRYGSWDVYEGQAFGELNSDLHQFAFEVPPEWDIWGSFDWGFAKPSVYLMHAHDQHGRIWTFAEKVWRKDGEVDVGLRKPDTELARDIKEFEASLGVRPRIRLADPACWSAKVAKDGMRGPSVAEEFIHEGVAMVKADNDRLRGRQQLHHRLALDENGEPGIFIHKRCRYLWETLPLMRESENNPEDIESKSPDHGYDALRYGILFRPMRPKARPKDTKVGSFEWERRKLIDANRRAKKFGTAHE